MRRAPFVSVLLPIGAIAGWAHLREPLHAAGLGLFLAPAIVLAVMAPAVILSVRSLPLLLIPRRTIRWWRHRQDHRPHIPVALRRAVYAADGYRCAWCGSDDRLQLDHVKPFSWAGLTVMWNLVTLCGYHNRVKSNYWKERDGYVHYRAWEGSENAKLAAQILAFEKRYRWRPSRWIRAGWSLAAL